MRGSTVRVQLAAAGEFPSGGRVREHHSDISPRKGAPVDWVGAGAGESSR